MLLKETSDINKREDTPCSQCGRRNIVKMTALPKAVCRYYNAIPMACSIETVKSILKLMWTQETANNKTNVQKEQSSKTHTHLGISKLNYKAAIIKTV